MFYVIRTYSHTDRIQLWKVESRPMPDRQTAENWKTTCESEYMCDQPKGKATFHVVEMIS